MRPITVLLLAVGLFFFNSGYGLASTKEDKPTIFTYRSPTSSSDRRYDYDTRLLELALENTKETDGPYQLVPSPPMTHPRTVSCLKTNCFPNLIAKLSYKSEYSGTELAFIPFPVDLGIVGYRVCFASPQIVEQLQEINSFDEYKKFSHGQGEGWADIAILRHNDLSVEPVSNYEKLFEMVSLNRFDLFCRGANELLHELRNHPQLDNLSYDKSTALFYPLPRFFYANIANNSALMRVRRGLIAAYNNGSLQKLWQDRYQESIDFVHLDQRRLFILKNPFLEGLDPEYQKYFYHPL